MRNLAVGMCKVDVCLLTFVYLSRSFVYRYKAEFSLSSIYFMSLLRRFTRTFNVTCHFPYNRSDVRFDLVLAKAKPLADIAQAV